MTSDQKFLKAQGIRPDDPKAENWMEWHEDDLAALRMSVANWINEAAELDALAKRWRAAAVLGWLFAAMLFVIPIIERWTK